MNYIVRLQKEVEHRDAAITRAREEIDAFLIYLHSSKFAGVDPDGDRKDWIATADVAHRLMDLRGALAVEVVS
jgi:hypothetical protein